MNSRSILRAVLITAGFVCAGAIQGALIGFLSLTPAWIADLIWPPRILHFDFFTLFPLVVISAPLGALLGPAFGWILLDRVPLWRILAEPTMVAIIGSWVAWPFMYLIPGQGGVTHLVVGAFLGAIAAVARLRVASGGRARHHVSRSGLEVDHTNVL